MGARLLKRIAILAAVPVLAVGIAEIGRAHV